MNQQGVELGAYRAGTGKGFDREVLGGGVRQEGSCDEQAVAPCDVRDAIGILALVDAVEADGSACFATTSVVDKSLDPVSIAAGQSDERDRAG